MEQSPVQPLFQNPTQLTKLLKYCVSALIVLYVLSIVHAFAEANLFTDIQNGIDVSADVVIERAEAIDSAAQLLGVVLIVQAIATGIVFFVWVYRANYNSRCLGASDMRFTPRWAVGWFFVPIANLWKPYQALKEIWQTSMSASDWKNQKAGPLLLWWWCLMWLSKSIDRGLAKWYMRTEDIAVLINIDRLAICATVLSIAVCVLFLSVVHRIYSFQMERFKVA